MKDSHLHGPCPKRDSDWNRSFRHNERDIWRAAARATPREPKQQREETFEEETERWEHELHTLGVR